MTDEFTLEWAALSDVGRKRANNEDAVRVEPEYRLAVLADGMGGYNAGEVASRMTVANVGDALIGWVQDAAARLADPRGAPFTVAAALQALQACADEANRAIFDDANAQPEHAGMGTTLVAALVYQGQLLIGHVGDSRAYRWRGGALAQLTRDHSVLQAQVDVGLLTPEQAAAAWRYRGLLTRGLGVEDTVLLDTQAEPLQPGDICLLCSDGLTDMVSDAEIAAVLGSGLPLPSMAQVLIAQANTAGGRDNITVALLRAGSKEAS
ncbi:MAG: protein phosphatase 2C domain-containing protein [Burkholderiaceae bacterium]|nr:protein phosphatase 2C domain-containing protein [Burkholderiaceae bacterium]